MSINKEQVVSYGVSGITGGGGWLARVVTDVSQWSTMEQLTAACMVLGAVGVIVRLYVDISEHRDRKRALQSEDQA